MEVGAGECLLQFSPSFSFFSFWKIQISFCSIFTSSRLDLASTSRSFQIGSQSSLGPKIPICGINIRSIGTDKSRGLSRIHRPIEKERIYFCLEPKQSSASIDTWLFLEAHDPRFHRCDLSRLTLFSIRSVLFSRRYKSRLWSHSPSNSIRLINQSAVQEDWH